MLAYSKLNVMHRTFAVLACCATLLIFVMQEVVYKTHNGTDRKLTDSRQAWSDIDQRTTHTNTRNTDSNQRIGGDLYDRDGDDRVQRNGSPASAQPETFGNISDRRRCVQSYINEEFGYDEIPTFLTPGCDREAVWNFDHWARRRCSKEHITENEDDSQGLLRIHTAWIGSVVGIFEEICALIDSFLLTHDVGGDAVFTLWLFETPNDDAKLAELKRMYNFTKAVRFIFGSEHNLARGTCLEDNSAYLNVSVSTQDRQPKSSTRMGPKEKADMLRLLILYQYGGIWVDTDSIILRNLRSALEYFGEFAAKVTMSPYYNNNVLGLRSGSVTAQKLIEYVCMTPFSHDTRKYCRYELPYAKYQNSSTH